jgi:hypothetical protein
MVYMRPMTDSWTARSQRQCKTRVTRANFGQMWSLTQRLIQGPDAAARQNQSSNQIQMNARLTNRSARCQHSYLTGCV